MYCYYKCSEVLPPGAIVGLQCVIVVFPDHTQLIFSDLKKICWRDIFDFLNVEICCILR